MAQESVKPVKYGFSSSTCSSYVILPFLAHCSSLSHSVCQPTTKILSQHCTVLKFVMVLHSSSKFAHFYFCQYLVGLLLCLGQIFIEPGVGNMSEIIYEAHDYVLYVSSLFF